MLGTLMLLTRMLNKVVDDVRSWALPLKPRPLGVQQELLNTLYLKTDGDLRPCEFSLYIALTYSREKIFLVEPTTKTERHGATTC